MEKIALVNCGVGDLVTGGCGLSGVPGRAAEFREAFRDAAKNARVLRAEVLHIGPSRIPSGESRDRCLQQLKGNVLHALDLLSGADCVLSIEALNLHEFPDILISSPETIVELIEDIGAPPARWPCSMTSITRLSMDVMFRRTSSNSFRTSDTSSLRTRLAGTNPELGS